MQKQIQHTATQTTLGLITFLVFLFFRFVPDKEFSGTDRTATRSGPVQFEKDEEDPFGLDQFLKQAKRASSSTATTKRKDDREQRRDDRDKRRKH